MTTKRRELINALVNRFNLDKDVYAIETIQEKTEFLNESQCLDFYQAVMAENTYGNGIKAIIKVAEQFKPVVVDDVEAKAKELIQLVESLNTELGKKAVAEGTDFIILVCDGIKLTIPDEDIAILNQVKPHNDHKQLIINIRLYQTSLDALKAFKNAIEYSESYSGAIECSRVSKMIGVSNAK